jgi:hypothetical protein
MKKILFIFCLFSLCIQAQEKLAKPIEDAIVVTFDTVLVEGGWGMEIHYNFSQEQHLRDQLYYNRTEVAFNKGWSKTQIRFYTDSCLISRQNFDKRERLIGEVYGRVQNGKFYVCQRTYNKKGDFTVTFVSGKMGGTACK